MVCCTDVSVLVGDSIGNSLLRSPIIGAGFRESTMDICSAEFDASERADSCTWRLLADEDDLTDAFDPAGDPVVDRLDFAADDCDLEECPFGFLAGSVATVSEMEVADDDSDAAEDARERSPRDDLDATDFAPSLLDCFTIFGFVATTEAASAAVDCCFCR